MQLRIVTTGIIATVEFYSGVSNQNSGHSILSSYSGIGPSALTKDKKQIHDEGIAVSVTWRSTLYVTDFREGMDDARI